MANVQDRRDRRFDVRIPVAILARSGEVKAFTDNASYRGILLRTSQPPPTRQLVRLRLTVPTEAADIFTNGMVAHARDLGDGISGVGVSFYGLDGAPRATWEKFIRSIQAQERALAEANGAARTVTSRAPHAGTELVVAVASVAALERLISRDIARGQIVIHDNSSLQVGAPVSVRLVHPATQHDFRLEGLVRSRLTGGALSIELPTMDDSTRTRLSEFTKGGEDWSEVIDFASGRPPQRSMVSQAFG
jgi:hypothetical protein